MILKVCVVIPTYNNPQTISTVVQNVLKQTPFRVLVVDDGSAVRCEQLCAPHSRLRILRFEENRGKGVALQAALHDCVAHGFTHMLAMDGDGQHLVSEITKLVEIARIHPWDMIIGNRQMESENVPGVSRFGRNFSNFWVNFQTGTRVFDSQSGFRLYPLFHLQNLKFWTRRFDFEIEVLIRLMWKGVNVRETDVEVFYPKQGERVSHFNKFWDNLRISALNTALVILSLLKSHQSPKEIGVATGLGAWIGSTPFFGFHTLIVAAASFLFRLNAVYLWLGSQVSIPPLAPFLIAGSIYVGSRILPNDLGEQMTVNTAQHMSFEQLLHWAGHSLLQWTVGSFVIGAGLALCVGSGSYIVATRMKTRKKTNWNGRTRGGTFGNGFLKLVLRYLGLGAGYFFLLFITPYFYLFAPKARRAMSEYWRLMAPDLSWTSRQFKIQIHFYRFGQVLMDRIFQNFSRTPQFQTVPHGIEHIIEPVKAGRGIILMSAHVGGWDLATSLLESDGLNNEINIVEYQAQGYSFRHVRGRPKQEQIQTLDSGSTEGDTIFRIHQILNQGRPLGLMGDRPLSDRFELVTFFGKLAPFDVTPFRIAAATRVPLLWTFGFKSARNPGSGNRPTYDFYANPSRLYQYSTNLDRELQCREWVQEFATHLENILRKYPDQWFNFYPFWSSLPVAPNGAQASTRPNHLEEERLQQTSWAPGRAPDAPPSGATLLES